MTSLFNLTNWRRIKKGPGTVTALVAMADPGARRAVRQALLRDIPASVIEVDSKKDFHHTVTFSEIDLIIADAELNGALSFDLVEQIRFGRLHCHAFPVVVMLVDQHRAGVQQQVIDSGVDLVLPSATPADLVADHVNRLSVQRKPFVVAPHYIGPERRAVPRENESTAEHIDVPNPLAARAGAVTEADYRRSVSVATHNISLLRRCLYTIRQVSPLPSRTIGNSSNGLTA
jgi:DNA-binding NarL/FixJ family response regulator